MKMEFTGKHKGILMEFGTKATKGEGAEITKAKIEIRMDGDALAQAVDSAFAESVFSFCVDDEQQGLTWTNDGFKPKGTYPMHSVQISGGKKLAIQPKLAKINPVKGEESVDVILELPFVCEDEAFAGKMHCKQAGSQITVALEVRSPELPLAGGTVVVSDKFGNPKHVPTGEAETGADGEF